MIRRLTLTVGLVVCCAAPLQGQVRIGLSGFVGGYLPATDLFESVRPDTTIPIILNLGHQPGLVAGGRLTVRFSRLALEAEAGYAFADLDVPSAISDAVSSDASIFLGSINVLYDLFRAPFSPVSIYVSGGVGIVARSGELLGALEATTDAAAALGMGLRFGLGPATFLRFDLRDYIASFAPRAQSGFQFDSRFQNELIGTLALEISLTPSQ